MAYPEGSGIRIDGTDYQLLQFHFHAPSEHTVDGKPFDMEMHLVHESEDGNLAVVGLLIESGRHHPAFDPIWASLPSSPLETQRIENGVIDLDLLLMLSEQTTDEAVKTFPSTYRYNGSLTTPPCSEGVKWIVLTTPVEMSESQIAAFKAIIDGNNRPVQPLNGRELLLRCHRSALNYFASCKKKVQSTKSNRVLPKKLGFFALNLNVSKCLKSV